MKHRSAFSLIELLVVLAIIGIIMALLIPAVSGVRATASRYKCIQNMGQLAMALNTYYERKDNYPPTISNTPSHGTLYNFLADLDQSTLARSYDKTKNWYDQPLATLQTPIPVFLCPATPLGNRRFAVSGGGKTIPDVSGCDYTTMANVQTGSPSANSLGLLMKNYTSAEAGGFLSRTAVTQRSQIKDGLSQTITFVENAARPFAFRLGKQVGDMSARSGWGGGWFEADAYIALHGYTIDGVNAGGPCGMQCTNDNEIYSFHGTGANFAFGDGSVRFSQKTIDIKILGALVTRAGSERVDPGF